MNKRNITCENMFFNSLHEYKEEITPLTVEEEKYWGEKLKYGTKSEKEKAKQMFFLHNIRLVISVASKLNRKLCSDNVSYQYIDAIQEGMIGLNTAINKFDYEKGFKFSTYAVNWINQAIFRSKNNKGHTIRIPVHLCNKFNFLSTEYNDCDLSSLYEKQDEICEKMNISKRQCLSLINTYSQYKANIISLDMPIICNSSSEETESCLVDLISDNKKSLEDTVLSNVQNEYFVHLIKKVLSEKEQVVILRRYGFLGSPETLRSISKDMNLTQERVRQIQNEALKKLRRILIRKEKECEYEKIGTA